MYSHASPVIDNSIRFVSIYVGEIGGICIGLQEC
jgi:hypothetical protein